MSSALDFLPFSLICADAFTSLAAGPPSVPVTVADLKMSCAAACLPPYVASAKVSTLLAAARLPLRTWVLAGGTRIAADVASNFDTAGAANETPEPPGLSESRRAVFPMVSAGFPPQVSPSHVHERTISKRSAVPRATATEWRRENDATPIASFKSPRRLSKTNAQHPRKKTNASQISSESVADRCM